MSLSLPRVRRGISGNSVFRMISFINKSRKLLTTYYLLLTTYYLLLTTYFLFICSGLLARLSKKECKLLQGIITLTVRTNDLWFCLKFLDRNENSKFLFTLIAQILVCRHNDIPLPS